MTLKLITGPTTEPVTLEEAKVQCRVDADITADDALIEALITAAREQCEHEIGRAVISQTLEQVLDAFPVDGIPLGRPDAAAVVSLKYIDEAGDEITLDPSLYFVDLDTMPGWVLPAEDTTWPTTNDTANAVRVRFTAGYGGTAADVPSGIKAWILMRVATLYKFREQIAAGSSIAELPSGFVDRMLDRYRAWGA